MKGETKTPERLAPTALMKDLRFQSIEDGWRLMMTSVIESGEGPDPGKSAKRRTRNFKYDNYYKLYRKTNQ